MFKLDFKKAEEPEVKLSTLLENRKSKRIPENHLLLFHLTTLKFLTMCITKNCGKLLEMGIPDHLTCLLRKLYAGQEATEPDMEQWTGSELGKQYVKAVYFHLVYLTYMHSTS